MPAGNETGPGGRGSRKGQGKKQGGGGRAGVAVTERALAAPVFV